jgi:DNA-binding transcriptional regulator YhcF (GntR family)
LETHDRIGSGVVPLTQEYLAVMVGVQRTTINSAAADLQSDGLIRYVRGKIEILDHAALSKRACECYAFSHQAFAQLAPDFELPANSA